MGEERLDGKTALVTGAAQRLGASIVRALAERGVHVMVHYNRGEAGALQLARDISAAGGRSSVVQADLSIPEAAVRVMDEAIRLAGPLDILVNNASIFDEVSFAETTADALQQNMAVNAVAPMLLSRLFAAQGRHGNIINMIDTMVTDYDKKHVPYHLSKKTLQVLTRVMAIEFAPAVRVNAVAPGLILPPKGQDEAYLERLVSSNPLHRHGDAADVVKAVLYLLQAEFVTGQTLYVDGGRHIRGNVYE